MKKKILILLTVLIMTLGFTACGGTEIVDEGKEVETELIAEIEYNGGGDDEMPSVYKEVLDKMEESDAQFFYMEWSNEDPNTPKGPLKLYQTDKATVDEIADKCADSSKSSKQVTAQVNEYLNYKHDSITRGKQTGAESSPDYNVVVDFIKGDNTSTVYDYYVDNKLDLMCENVKATKMAIMLNGINEQAGQKSYYYLFICEGDVTTETKSSDSFNIFPEVGVTDTITVKIAAFASDADGECGIEDMFFD